MSSPDVFSVSPQEQMRLTQAQQLGSLGAEKTTELLEMLTDSSWVVRRAVVEALADIGDPAIEPLSEQLRTRRDNEARIAAMVDALVASRGEPDAALRRLATDSDTAVITDALQIFGRRRSESSVPLLIEMTQHPDDIVAVGAIEALGRIGGRSAVESLIATVNSGNFFRTFPAIDILGRSGDRRVVEHLVALLQNSTYLPEAVRALGRTGEKAAVAPLTELLKSTSDSVVRVAAVALWDLRQRFEDNSGGSAIAIDELLKTHVETKMILRIARVMSNLDAVESVAVCNLLGAIGSSEATPLLVAKLDGPPNVAASAAEALKKIGLESDRDLLHAIETGDSARRKALLPTVTRTAAALDVMKCLTDSDSEIRALACDTLARLGNPAVVSQLFPLLEDTNVRVVHAATAAVQALGSRESRTLAVEASRSQKPLVRRAALRILAYFGDADSLQPMIFALQDEDVRVREVAIQGLPYLEDPLAYNALCETAKSSDARTRALAMRSLALFPKADERTYSILLRGLKDEDSWVRYYACQSMGRLRYSAASLEVAELLNDEAGQVRVAAIEALSHLESREAHRTLQRAARSEEPDVRRAALVGLGITRRSEDLSIILDAVASPDVSTRLVALSAMVSFGSPLVIAALSSSAKDADEQVRSTAIGFLAARPEAEATELLVELVSSDLSREAAKAALLVPQVNRSAGILIALESASEELAPVLIAILLRIPRPDARRALLAAMKLNNVAARKAAAAGLAANLDDEKRAILRDAADNDPDQSVRAICLLILSE